MTRNSTSFPTRSKISEVLLSKTGMTCLSLLFLVIWVQPCLDFIPRDTVARWWDQSRYLHSLNSVLNRTQPTYLIEGWHGVGYIWIAKIFYKWIVLPLGGAPFDSFVWLNRLSLGLDLVLVIQLIFMFSPSLRRSTEHSTQGDSSFLVAPFNRWDRVSVLVYVMTLIISCNFFLAIDIPWSHYVTSTLALILIWIGSKQAQLSSQLNSRNRASTRYYVYSVLLGFFLALLFLTRFFEFWICTPIFFLMTLGYLIKNYSDPNDEADKSISSLIKPMFFSLSLMSATFILTIWLIYLDFGLQNFHYFYFNLGSIDPATQATLQPNSIQIPIKLIQMFFDPALFAFKDDHDGLPPLFAMGPLSWKAPLIVQLPIYWYFIGTAALITRRLSKNPYGWISFGLTMAALILIAGYLSSPLTGALHLKNGFFRDFITPTFLLAIGLAPTVLFNSETWIIKFVPLFISLLFQIGFSRYFPIYSDGYFTIDRASASSICRDGECHYKISTQNSLGREVQMPGDRFIINVFCPTGDGILKTHRRDPNALKSYYCLHSFFENCRDLGSFSAFTVTRFEGNFRQPQCSQPPRINIFAASLGNAHVPADKKNPPIIVDLNWNGQKVEDPDRWLRAVKYFPASQIQNSGSDPAGTFHD